MLNNKLPIPNHLKDILIPMGEANDEFHIDGAVRCTCGSETFSVSVYGGKSELDPKDICVGEYEDNFALMVKAECLECHKNHLIFDMHRHGWDGFVCHDGVTVPDEKLYPWSCKECNSDVHHLTMTISSQGKEDYVENLCDDVGEGKEFSEDDWAEAFEWITINLVCYHCGFEDARWIDFETM